MENGIGNLDKIYVMRNWFVNHICQSLALENIVSTYKTYNSNLNLAILKIKEKKKYNTMIYLNSME